MEVAPETINTEQTIDTSVSSEQMKDPVSDGLCTGTLSDPLTTSDSPESEDSKLLTPLRSELAGPQLKTFQSAVNAVRTSESETLKPVPEALRLHLKKASASELTLMLETVPDSWRKLLKQEIGKRKFDALMETFRTQLTVRTEQGQDGNVEQTATEVRDEARHEQMALEALQKLQQVGVGMSESAVWTARSELATRLELAMTAELSAPLQATITLSPPNITVRIAPNDTEIDLNITPEELDAIEIDPANEKTKIAEWGWSAVSTTTFLGHYGSEAEAVAAIATTNNPGAVFLEQGRYVAYRAYDTSSLYDFQWSNCYHDYSKPWTNVEFVDSARVIVTEDGVPIYKSQYRTDDQADAEASDESLMPGSDDLLAGFLPMFEDGSQGRSDFIQAFGAAMKTNALTVVHRARAEADTFRTREAQGKIAADEIALMQGVARQLEDIEDDLAQAYRNYNNDPEAGGSIKEGTGTIERKKRARKRYADAKATIMERRRGIVARYPVTGQIEDIRAFNKLAADKQLDLLGNEVVDVLENIDDTRDNIVDGSLDLWLHRNVVEATLAGLNIRDEQKRQWALEKCASDQSWDVAGKIALGVFALGFGIGAAVFTGGTSLAMAAGAVGLGAADAIMATNEYMVNSAAGNTDLNPDESVIPPDVAGHWGWLVVAWVGVGLDAMDLVRILKSAKGIDEVVEVLSRSDPKLAEQVRKMAKHQIGADDLVNMSNKDILSQQLGAKIDIDDGLGDGVRVHYDIDAHGAVKITGVRVGPGANVLDILGHTEVIRLMRRYEGVTGKLRMLFDRLFSFGPANPFPPGSRAYESWLELEKLPSLIEARRAKLGSQSDGLTAAKEAQLRADVEFLEGELQHHQRIVDQVSLEKGVGFVAKGEDSTRAAIAWGLPKLEGNPMIEDASKYYYRRAADPNKVPPFDLVRTAVDDGPPRSVVHNGSDWTIVEGKLSRSERAEALVNSWPSGVQTAFASLQATMTGAFKVVPLQGVAATGKKIGQLKLPSGFDKEMRRILARAFKNSGSANPAADATAALAALKNHDITVVKGTDQLRAYNYSLKFPGDTPEKDLHHIIALYVGGDHRLLANVNAADHKRMHELFDGIQFGDGVSMAPSSIQNASQLSFSEGAAALMPDGTVKLFKLLDGSYVAVP